MSVRLRDRFAILAAADFRCHYCGRSAGPNVTLQVDHVIPLSKGGTDDRSNLVAACWDCNQGKAATELAAFPRVIWTPVLPMVEVGSRCIGEAHSGPFVEFVIGPASDPGWKDRVLVCETCGYLVATRPATRSA